MNCRASSNRSARLVVWALLGLLIGPAAGFASTLVLQGQSKGSSAWISGNLQNWKELDYIPCRIAISGGSVNSQTIRIFFPHLTGTTPGFQNLSAFTTAGNVTILSGPTLTAPAVGDWYYTFAIKYTGGGTGHVNFKARLAAGSHLNTGSSLMLSGDPSSMGNLQIHKPGPGPGLPDLAIVKSGPAAAAPNATITYTLSYTNKTTATTAVGVQICDILPGDLTVNAGSLPANAQLVGNTIFWDLTNLVGRANGQVSFQAQIKPGTPGGRVLTNFAQILSSENDANMADNCSTWLTTVTLCQSPVITNGPSSAVRCPGDSVSFSVAAGGSAPLSYQWRKGGSNIFGATGSTYSIPAVSAAHAGSYVVVVSNACGTATSGAATLTVNTPPAINDQPQGAVRCPGDSVSFSVSATGTGLTYQWRKDGTNISGANDSAYSIPFVMPGNAGSYDVVVGGACGNLTSTPATLTVNSAVTITGQPVSAMRCPGGSVSFSVGATGTGLSYQWRKGGTNLLGATSSTLTISPITAADAGDYDVVVTGVCGSQTSIPATLTVNIPVSITDQPVGATLCPSNNLSFSVSATGTDLSYQWRKDTTNIVGATGITYNIPSVTADDAGSYDVVVTGACGSQISAPAILNVNRPVVVGLQPFISATKCPGDSMTFSVAANGTGLTYQWLKNGTNIAGATNSVYTIASVTAADAGIYSVLLTGACNSLTASVGALAVNENVAVEPLSGTVRNIGDSATFTAVASGTGPFTYIWKRDSDVLSETSSTLTLANLQFGDSGLYSVEVSGACGNAATAAAVLVVNRPPTVSISYPTNNSIFVAPATFSVLANASDPDDVIGAGTSVTNVEFFASTDGGATFLKVGETNAAPYFIVLTDLPTNHYILLARATDDLGATGDSAPVNVDVVPSQAPTVTVVGRMVLNLQDGYQWLTNVVYNPVNSHAEAARVYIYGITNPAIQVVNATGVTNGISYVQSPGAIQPGSSWTNVIKFYNPVQAAFFPVLQVELVPVSVGGGAAVSGTPQAIFGNPQYLRNGTFLIEFATLPNRTYYVQYRNNMEEEWETVPTPFAGNGMHLLWIDAGPPETKSLPSTSNSRYYRVLLAP